MPCSQPIACFSDKCPQYRMHSSITVGEWRGVYLLPAPIHALYVTSTVKTPINYPEKFYDLSNNLHQAQHLKAMYAELASLLTSMVKRIWASVEA